jgi:hypothetical protein
MENAAHAESLDHEVYRTPLIVQPEFEYRDTPGSYRRSHLGPDKLPDKFKVWRVQETQEGNVIARSYGFGDSPDTEILAVGFNHGKNYGAVGIGRHGNFLQWGYSDPPSKMTEAGRRLFLNCIHYIQRFDGKVPLVRWRCIDRLNAVRLAPIGDRLRKSAEEDSTFTPGIAMDILRRYPGDPNGLARHFQDNIEWVYYDKGLRVDEELKALGIDSNRKVETLARLFELLKDETHAQTPHAGSWIATRTGARRSISGTAATGSTSPMSAATSSRSCRKDTWRRSEPPSRSAAPLLSLAKDRRTGPIGPIRPMGPIGPIGRIGRVRSHCATILQGPLAVRQFTPAGRAPIAGAA